MTEQDRADGRRLEQALREAAGQCLFEVQVETWPGSAGALYGKAADMISALLAADEDRERLRDWQATVTAALRRPGGAFYDDVPKHIRELVDRAEAAEAALAREIQNAKFDAACAEGERISERCFSELPLDANVSDGNESADPADHIVPCVRAAITERDREIAELRAALARERQAHATTRDEQWRPIETALGHDPVLLAVERDGVRCVGEASRAFSEDPRDGLWYWAGENPVENDSVESRWKILGWTPLPEAPAALASPSSPEQEQTPLSHCRKCGAFLNHGHECATPTQEGNQR